MNETIKEDKAQRLYQALGGVDPALLREAEARKPRRGRLVFLKYAAAAACLALLVCLFTLSGRGNAFSVTAYALERDGAGTITLRPTDLADLDRAWGGLLQEDGTFYASVALNFQGENIRSVTFSTENGFFASQSRNTPENASDLSVLSVEGRQVMAGETFHELGDNFTLTQKSPGQWRWEKAASSEAEDDPADCFWYWGTHLDMEKGIILPAKAEITASVTFQNGQTQSVPITIRFSDSPSAVVIDLPEALTREHEREYAYYQGLSLKDCQLQNETILAEGETWEVSIDDSTSYFELRSDIPFDENGRYFRGFVRDNENRVYLQFIWKTPDGLYICRQYRVPEKLEYAGGSSDRWITIPPPCA